MIDQCSAQNNHFSENMSHQSICDSVTTDNPQPADCESINPTLLHPNVLSNLTTSNLRHQNMPNSLHTNMLHHDTSQDCESIKQQGVSSCAVSCVHQNFRDSSFSVGQLMNPSASSQSNGSNSTLTLSNTCDPHILVSHTPSHQSLTSQMDSNQPSNANQMNTELNEQLHHTINPNLSNANQHIIMNLMNSTVNQSEVPSINPANQDMSNSIMSLNQHIESNIAASMNLTQQMNSVNSSHQNMNIPLLSTLSSASPNLGLSQNFNNLSSSLPMNFLMTDPMPNQSNTILTSYHSSSSCGNYSPFDSSISWLTDNRNFLVDRNYNNSRLGMLENIGLCSPNSVESLSKNSKEVGNFSTKACLSSLHDPVQSWLSISNMTNQPPMKYNDQISPNINLMHFDQSDLQKFDMGHRTSEALKNLNVDCAKPADSENKSIKNNCSSPKNKLNYLNQPMLAVNTEFSDTYDYNIPCISNITPCYPMDSLTCKYGYNFSSSKNLLDYPVGSIPEINELGCSKTIRNTQLSTCAKNTANAKDIKCSDFSNNTKKGEVGEHCSVTEHHPGLYDRKLNKRNDCMKANEAVCDGIDLDNSCDGSEESDIIVEDSDSRSAEEDQNEISVDSVKTILIDEEIDFSGGNTSNTITLRCFICDLSTTTVPANQFIHTNNEFPVMSVSKTPVVTKLLEIVPARLQKYVTIENHFMCCRCFNLIETVESLETKLKSTKDFLNETLSRTITIANIRDSKLNKVEMSSLEEWFQSGSPDPQTIKSGDALKLSGKALDLNNEVALERAVDVVPPKIVQERPEVMEDITLRVEENVISTGEDDVSRSENILTSRFSCQECGQDFDNSNSLSDHHSVHLEKFSVTCSDCGKGFKSKSKLKQHILIHIGNFSFLCDICGRMFRQKHHFKDHILKHSGKFKFRCKTCNKGFMQKSTLRIHLNMHSLNNDPQICQHCGKKFSNKWNLTAHINVCTNEMQFECQLCRKKFHEKRRLDDHIQSVHENKYKFICSQCKKGFMKKSSLDAHMVVHSSIKSFVCQKCGKSYKTLSNLNQHSKVHSVSAQFNCTLCEAKFLRKNALEAHLNNHKGQKPYKCPACAKIFASEHYLKIHQKLHDKRNKCATCSDCGSIIKNHPKPHKCIHREKRVTIETCERQMRMT